ncbi:C40 family peptidase [Paenibacillus radicis (ex Xue et al. 2023)]|uniref:C40 family peptidase n=1 Tax=Paenibacillus radicis (ex Xue et al. 2023) TaxID=2972489 RepID=A0ABT1YT81_9BACL|nr:SH3 domain-containing C40 family peptidase [Paenibacillus radicis (ex Xue et al. 2023)]MCR8636397.1 C40 family peptidase [Paenibacillus radicis (ex Xue et al. 2023)]
MKKFLATLLIAATVTTGASLIAPTEAHAAPEATIVSSVNFRSAPNTSASSLRLLKTGEKIQIISKVNDYWYYVQTTQGQLGYISTSSKYVKYAGAGSSTGGGSGSGSGSSSNTVNKIISAGKKYLGTPYEFGSDRSNTRTFDCSDFVRQAFKDGAGVTLPSDSRGQGSYVKSLGKSTSNWRNLKAGDLMFFMDYKGTSKSAYPSNTSNQTITHVGIYLGNGQILHTYSKDSGGVRIDSIAGKHWEYRFMFGGSALK